MDIDGGEGGGRATEPPELFVTGIGASAGGLEAIREMVGTLPADDAAAYVVIQHLSPRHKSLLATLIDRETDLRVLDVVDNVVIEANTIYVAPPNVEVIYETGRLRLQAADPDMMAPKPSVDRFFTSLAEGLGARAVGVIMSGTGSDGAYGVRAIHGAGGVVIAQDDATAKYDGMPIAAIETGCVDLVLSPHDIARQLSKILRTSRANLDQFKAEAAALNPLTDLLQILFAKTRVDFRDYKMSTVQRRVERRMTALGVADLDEYISFCRSHPEEIDALFRDMLITVTRFFRDSGEFRALERALAPIIERNSKHPTRIWVPGCATGEEAYSIAILLAEALGGLEHVSKSRLQIFATDIDLAALAIARRGVYPLSAVADIEAGFVERYFRVQDDTVRVQPSLQELIVFSEHNVCQDPPFSSIDLVSCRNLLIYFNGNLQKKVLSRFHYALKSTGLLFLGKAENIGGAEDLFSSAERGAQLYEKRAIAGSWDRNFPPAFSRLGKRPEIVATETLAAQKQASIDRAMFDALARSFDAPALLVSNDHQILRVYGDVTDVVALTEATRLKLSVDMLRGPLAQAARTLINLAVRTGARKQSLPYKVPGLDRAVRLEAVPLSSAALNEDAILVLLHRAPDAPTPEAEPAAPEADGRSRIRALETEVLNEREAHRYTIEELETSNEELQSLNEELQSANEELQATNEELETSNEELQSTNEELITVNEELQVNTAELTMLNQEFDSLMRSIEAPILFVDSGLNVTRASAPARALFQLARPSDRPHVSQCAVPVGFPNLAEVANEALRLGRTITRELFSGSTAYVLTCAPFTDVKDRLSGAMLIFSETPAAAELSRELRHLFENSPVILMRRDRDGRVIRASEAAARALGAPRDQLEGAPLGAHVAADTVAAVKEADRTFLESGVVVRTDVETMDIGGRTAHWRTDRYRFFDRDAHADTVYAISLDDTAIIRHQKALEEVLTIDRSLDPDFLGRIAKLLRIGASHLGFDQGRLLQERDGAFESVSAFGGERPSLSGAAFDAVCESALGGDLASGVGPIAADGVDRAYVASAATLMSGGRVVLAFFAEPRGLEPASRAPLTALEGQFVQLLSRWIAYKLDRQRQLEALRAQNAQLTAQRETLEHVYQRTPVMMLSIDPSGRIVDVSDQWLETLGYARAEVIGRRATEFLTEESRERAADALAAFWRDGRCDHVASDFVRKDGCAFAALLSGRVDQTEPEAPRALAVITQRS